MSFEWPLLLALLIVIPVGILIDRTIAARRASKLAGFGSLGVPRTASGKPLGWRSRVPAALFLLGFTIMVVALARPQAVVSLPRLEGTVILAFDVSGSMAATDFAPTRIEAAKTAAKAFVEKQPPGIVIGVVAFSDSGFAVQVPTDDQATILSAIDRLAPTNGTSLGQGLLTALNTIAISENGPAQDYYTNRSPAPSGEPAKRLTTDPTAVIILLTDGENNEAPDPLQVAALAQQQGVRIETVGIGDPAGTTLEVNGFKIFTQLNEALLKGIADSSGGDYHPAKTEPDLQKVYDNIDTHLVVKPEEMEVTSLFAGAAILLLVAGGLLSLRWLGRAL